MKRSFKTEVYKCIRAINIEKINENDKKELLSILIHTENPLIRNHIALIFSDLKYSQAVPYIIKKIMNKSTYNDNGTLVYALENLVNKKHFIPLIKIICEMDYEARLEAYGIIKDLRREIPIITKNHAIKLLEAKQKELDNSSIADKGENSTLHFVEKTLELLDKTTLSK